MSLGVRSFLLLYQDKRAEGGHVTSVRTLLASFTTMGDHVTMR